MTLETLATLSIVNGMNAHNQEIMSIPLAGIVTLVDRCGNVYTMHVWVRDDNSLKYLLASNSTPRTLSDMFPGGNLPASAIDFDDSEDMFQAIIHTKNHASSVSYQIDQIWVRVAQ